MKSKMVSFLLKLPTMASIRQSSISKRTNSPTIPVFFLLFFFFHVFVTIPGTSYRPVEHFAVNCGNSGNIPANDQRNWTGDIGSTLFSLIDPSNSTQPIKAEVLNSQPIPYDTARLSRSEFSYSFLVTDGQKFVRLFFYPSSFGDYLRSDSLFSVKVGNHTLLKDFNASLNADARSSLNTSTSEGVLVQEYCVNIVLGQRLNITFTPNRSYPNAYAFINGIEVVSMPTFLYYTNPDSEGMSLNGYSGYAQYSVQNDRALETMYRINVGGRQIPSEIDTGMFRNWEPDIAYLESGERNHSVSAAFGLSITYKDDQNYFAPDEVYKTARNYGMKETSEFNVTWKFEVDSEFFYMVRLHFCEFDEQIAKAGERVFQVFINDDLVEGVADVMFWTQNQILVPVRRDYAIMLINGSLKKLNLSIKLQPHPTARSLYRDILLNGIEILKISNYNDNLAGPNPDPLQSAPPPPPPSSKSSKC